jgi:hypothetical protein
MASNSSGCIRHAAIRAALCVLAGIAGCGPPGPKPYGQEHELEVPGLQSDVWAVAPAINLSGHSEVDPILQADLVYQQLQSVHGMTAVPVDRVAQVFAALNIDRIESAQQASLVCDLLQVDAIVVTTITTYDPYAPPKMAASLTLFRKPIGYVRPAGLDTRQLGRQNQGEPARLKQSAGIFDASNGTVREKLLRYAMGRSDPNGPMAEREYFLNMDRYTAFVYHQLIADLLGVPAEPVVVESK